MSLLKVDQIADAAGTGKPDFVNGFKTTATKSEVWVEEGNGHGSTNTVIRRFTTTVKNTGSDITYADSATLGATFTINTSGLYAMTYGDYYSASDTVVGISVNSNQLTTSIGSITNTHRLAVIAPGTNLATMCSFIGWFTASDVIRAHTNGSANITNVRVYFKIAKLIG